MAPTESLSSSDPRSKLESYPSTSEPNETLSPPKSNPSSPNISPNISSALLRSSSVFTNLPVFTASLASFTTFPTISLPISAYFLVSALQLAIYAFVSVVEVVSGLNFSPSSKASGYKCFPVLTPRLTTDLATFLRYPFTPLGALVSLLDLSTFKGKNSSSPPVEKEKSSFPELLPFFIYLLL